VVSELGKVFAILAVALRHLSKFQLIRQPDGTILSLALNLKLHPKNKGDSGKLAREMKRLFRRLEKEGKPIPGLKKELPISTTITQKQTLLVQFPEPV
jgi:hypothetical protein